MNEYLVTELAAEHRRELLEEARSNGLARIAREGHPSFWAHLAEGLASVVRGRWSDRRSRLADPTHRLAH